MNAPLARLLAALLSAGFCLGPAARAQEVKPEDRNAAIRYATIAYTHLPDLFAKTGDVDMTKVGFDAAALPADFKAALDALKADGGETVRQVMEATKLRKCDFEPPWEQGVEVLLPHLGKMRTYTRLLRADARRLEIEGDADAAAERLAAMVRLARHATNDHILISALVGTAIGNAAMLETEDALAAGRLTRSARATVLAAISTLDSDDPFAIKPALRGEQRWILEWVKATFRGPDAGKKLVATGYLSPGESDRSSKTLAAIQAISNMNEKQLHEAADRATQYYDKTISVWSKPDAAEQLKSAEADLERGEFGHIAQVFAPAVTKAFDASRKAESRITALKQKLAATE